jgi:hypothetical protein
VLDLPRSPPVLLLRHGLTRVATRGTVPARRGRASRSGPA